jgi:hypothetical protein
LRLLEEWAAILAAAPGTYNVIERVRICAPPLDMLAHIGMLPVSHRMRRNAALDLNRSSLQLGRALVRVVLLLAGSRFVTQSCG